MSPFPDADLDEATLADTDASLRVLRLLGAEPANASATLAYLEAEGRDGRYGRGTPTDALQATRSRALALGQEVVEDPLALEQILRVRLEDGSFTLRPGTNETGLPYRLAGTRDAVAVLGLLGASPDDWATTRAWLDEQRAAMTGIRVHYAVLAPLAWLHGRPVELTGPERVALAAALERELVAEPTNDTATIKEAGWLVRTYGVGGDALRLAQERILDAPRWNGAVGYELVLPAYAPPTADALEALGAEAARALSGMHELVRLARLHERRDGGFADWHRPAPTLRSSVLAAELLALVQAPAEEREEVTAWVQARLLAAPGPVTPSNAAPLVASPSGAEREARARIAEDALISFLARPAAVRQPEDLLAAARIVVRLESAEALRGELLRRIGEFEAVTLDMPAGPDAARLHGLALHARHLLGSVPPPAVREHAARSLVQAGGSGLDLCTRLRHAAYGEAPADEDVETLIAAHLHPTGLWSATPEGAFPDAEATLCALEALLRHAAQPSAFAATRLPLVGGTLLAAGATLLAVRGWTRWR